MIVQMQWCVIDWAVCGAMQTAVPWPVEHGVALARLLRLINALMDDCTDLLVRVGALTQCCNGNNCISHVIWRLQRDNHQSSNHPILSGGVALGMFLSVRVLRLSRQDSVSVVKI